LQEKLNLKNTLFIDSTNRQENEEIIYKNFDANCPKDEQENRYDILITTDTLAEGVNLHRSDTLINYDLPWNSTRLMQRLGRINRIGTQFDKLNIYSFMPVNKSNEVIKIEEKSYLKLQSFHHTLGEDSKILFNDEEVSSFGIEDEVDEELLYLQKLRDFKEKYPDEFEKLKNQTELSVCIPKKENKELFYFKLGKTSYFFEKEDKFKFIDFLEFIKHLENIKNFKNIPSKADEAIEFYKNQMEVKKFIKNNLKKTLTKTEKEAIYLIQNWYKKDLIDKLTKERLIELIQNKTLKTLAQQILKLKDKSEKEIEQETKKFLKSTSKTAEEKISAKAYIKLEEKC
jgi:superfamily II DNA/RNA helicase